jgi:hypothetical protein
MMAMRAIDLFYAVGCAVGSTLIAKVVPRLLLVASRDRRYVLDLVIWLLLIPLCGHPAFFILAELPMPSWDGPPVWVGLFAVVGVVTIAKRLQIGAILPPPDGGEPVD